jgi:hypothetical protein
MKRKNRLTSLLGSKMTITMDSPSTSLCSCFFNVAINESTGPSSVNHQLGRKLFPSFTNPIKSITFGLPVFKAWFVAGNRCGVRLDSVYLCFIFYFLGVTSYITFWRWLLESGLGLKEGAQASGTYSKRFTG